MKSTFAVKDFARKLGFVQKAALGRTTLPVLGNVHLEATNGHLRLTATDLAIALSAEIEAVNEVQGAYTVPAAKLAALAALASGEEATASLERSALTLTTTGTRASLKGIDAGEFPHVPALDSAAALALDGPELARAIRLVSFAVAGKDGAPTYQNVHFGLSEKALTLTATDGLGRAAEMVMPLPVAPPVVREGLVTPQALAPLASVAGDVVEMQLTEARALFRTGAYSVVAQLHDGKFPDMRRVMPSKFATQAVLDVAAFRLACKRAEVYAAEVAHTGRFAFAPGKLTVAAVSAETGDSASEIEAEVSGPGLELALNLSFVLQGLAAVDTERVCLGLNSKTSPVVMTMPDNDAWHYVIMPMHLGK
jgi:DNA polymerase-3 subunit beta